MTASPADDSKPPFQAAWWGVLSLVALDYLTTLAYQPSLAIESAGRLAPVGTLVVALVTLFGALPAYWYVAGRSPHGGGAAALLERLIPGWRGKFLIVVLLGFTATDFVFTRTFSAAAAAEHLLRNPSWGDALESVAEQCRTVGRSYDHPAFHWLLDHGNKQLSATLILLVASSVLALVFLRGYTRNVLRLTSLVALLFIAVNAIVIGCGLVYLIDRPALLETWWQSLLAGDWRTAKRHDPTDAAGIVAAGLAVFPKLALGLSGFELTMIVMPLVRGKPGDDPRHPAGRIRGTRTLLVVAALLGSVALVSSSLVATLLVPTDAILRDNGAATHRALSYLAHGGGLATGDGPATVCPLFGDAFGTAYDAITILTLCLAGASVSIGLRDFVPPYLHRLGMELNWSVALGMLLHLFTAVKLIVTVYFHADLDAQRNAYATAVLALLSATAFAAALDRWQSRCDTVIVRRIPWVYATIAAGMFAAMTYAIVLQPAGLRIASLFIVAILLTSMVSRSLRTTELRCQGFDYVDDDSRFLWQSLRPMDFPVLVPHRPGERSLVEKEALIRKYHRIDDDVPIVFVEVTLGDPSGFYHRPTLEVTRIDGRFVIRIERGTSVAHVLTEAALELSRESVPPELHFGWSDESPLTANLHFVLFGHGNVPWMVNYLLQRAEPNAGKRPRVIIG